ncbi:MAG: thioredoxin domain-containing protein [Bacteriovoracaceae bacterium]|nr:thioredoxin domain-containing protein [Bacteriovoracaceae bacterium]
MNKKLSSLTLNGLTFPYFFLLISLVSMIIISFYLTAHYFSLNFPMQLGSSESLCDFSSFWNCHGSTLSGISHIAKVPLSFLGTLFALCILLAILFPSEKNEKTCGFFISLNALLCLGLLFYSLLHLGGLCPFCSLYYLFSWICCFLFFKYSLKPWKPSAKTFFFFALLVLSASFAMRLFHLNKEQKYDKFLSSLTGQYDSLKVVGDPTSSSPFRIHSATEDFSKAPLRLSIFSDFQCPYCRVLASQIHALIQDSPEFKDKLNVQYFFWPMDICNPQIRRPAHPLACKASYLAACAQNNFPLIHDLIFENQKKLSDKWLEDTAGKYNLLNCYKNAEPKEDILMTIQAGEFYNINATPIIILNGVKIEGVLPLSALKALFHHLLKK